MHNLVTEVLSRRKNCETRIDPAKGRFFSTRRPILLIILGVSLVSGCQEQRTIWSSEARSTDGYWLASARTVQHSGPGNAGLYTSVFLRRTNDPGKPEEVLGFSFDAAYPTGASDVKMNWKDSSHLDVTYGGHADLYFQVVKYAGITISVRDLENETIKSPR
jgi:hypothetical protein